MTVTIDGATSDGIKQDKPKITTIIFDVDDTLYDVGTVSVSFHLSHFSCNNMHIIITLYTDTHILHNALISNIQGFTAHRNTDGATNFMIDKLHFPSKEEALKVRDEYFKIYHSTAKVSESYLYLYHLIYVAYMFTYTMSYLCKYRDSLQQKQMANSLHFLQISNFHLVVQKYLILQIWMSTGQTI